MDVKAMDKLHIMYYIITLLYLFWGTGYITEHTPCENIWDMFIVLGGIAFLSWYSLMFWKAVFGL